MNTPAAFLRLACLALAALTCGVAALRAQTPPPPAKRLPPAGIQLSDTARAELTAGARALRQDLDALAQELARPEHARRAALLPDIEVLHKAVDWPLRYDEFFDLRQVDTARQMLALARERISQLRAGQAPWTEATGTILRGYRSKLDGSVQPYAVTVPAGWTRAETGARRLDVVLLGRGEKRTELAFMAERLRPPGEGDIIPEGAIVLHPYGRFCNATKFAGEVDVMEALEAVRRTYRIDPLRTVVRGFSMGGASTWHLAAHYPHLWAAAAPGAGFAETAAYTKALAPGKPERQPWEQTLWRWYDATGYAANFLNLPVIAYSGEIDPQKQAAEIMSQAMAAEGLTLEHHIGPGTAHKYHPETKATLVRRLEEVTRAGRNPFPRVEHFTTYTLRYPNSDRIRIMELEQHWERADVRLTVHTPEQIEVSTRNVAVFTLALAAAQSVTVTIDGQSLSVGDPDTRFWFAKLGGRWTYQDRSFAEERWERQLRKTPGRTGPINDAFMEPFLFVRPTGKPLSPAQGAWAEAELTRAVRLWRDLFRGDVPIKNDVEVTDEDLATRNIVLWGDPSSNRLLARLLEQLPLRWTAQTLTVRGKTYDGLQHAPVLIYPNPHSAAPRYIVVNSGIDFREEAFGTNALQTPKLPDYAVIDLRVAPGPRWPGAIVDAGFFDETWK